MIQSSRYITSRKEYERMVNASDPKAALDAFWLSCGNEKEASATLIATYYGRVEEANRYFSGCIPDGAPTEAWCTSFSEFPTRCAAGQTANGGYTAKRVRQCPRLSISARRTPLGQ